MNPETGGVRNRPAGETVEQERGASEVLRWWGKAVDFVRVRLGAELGAAHREALRPAAHRERTRERIRCVGVLRGKRFAVGVGGAVEDGKVSDVGAGFLFDTAYHLGELADLSRGPPGVMAGRIWDMARDGMEGVRVVFGGVPGEGLARRTRTMLHRAMWRRPATRDSRP